MVKARKPYRAAFLVWQTKMDHILHGKIVPVYMQLQLLLLVASAACAHGYAGASLYRPVATGRAIAPSETSLTRSFFHGVAAKQRSRRVVSCGMGVVELGQDNSGTDKVMSVLKNIIDPDAGDDIVSLGYIKDVSISSSNDVTFTFDNTKISDMLVKQINESCIKELKQAIKWINNINIVDSRAQTSPASKLDLSPKKPPGMQQIKHIIAVSSCKGGVGKSTVSVNLAFTLKAAGAKVGILDADIYGPSLPTMTKPKSTEIVYANEQLQPLEYDGVKLMSMGFINKGASIMRGPMVNQILNQFVSLCNWGDLDYLIVDMPPGTGDIQLTLAQLMDISAAVIVTTPQRLSFVDVVKGIDMFDTVNIPCVAVVENMAEYSTYNFNSSFYNQVGFKIASAASIGLALSSDVDKLSSSIATILKETIEQSKIPHKLFGDGHTQRLRDMWGIENIIALPLLEEVSRSGDSGIPYVAANSDSTIALKMIELANGVISEIDRISDNRGNSRELNYDTGTNSILFDGKTINPYDLRCDCKCATCVEELTGKKLLNVNSVPKDLRPLGMAGIGRYAMSIDWSDGHKSLYPFRQISNLQK